MLRNTLPSGKLLSDEPYQSEAFQSCDLCTSQQRCVHVVPSLTLVVHILQKLLKGLAKAERQENNCHIQVINQVVYFFFFSFYSFSLTHSLPCQLPLWCLSTFPSPPALLSEVPSHFLHIGCPRSSNISPFVLLITWQSSIAPGLTALNTRIDSPLVVVLMTLFYHLLCVCLFWKWPVLTGCAGSSHCYFVGSKVCSHLLVAQFRDDYKFRVMNLSFFSTSGLVYFLSSPGVGTWAGQVVQETDPPPKWQLIIILILLIIIVWDWENMLKSL